MTMGFKFKLYYLPTFTTTWFCLTFLTSYLVAVLNQHVNAFLPFISDTGTLPPESCIFGQMLNIASVIMLVTVYIKYRVIKITTCNDSKYQRWNNWSVFFGSLSCLGMSIVANFQETNVLVVHFIGACMAFLIGSIYFLILTWITWISDASKRLKFTRIALSSLLIPIYISTMVLANYMEPNDGPVLIWPENNDGYRIRLAATIFEWIMAILITLYILTFTSEFKSIEFDEIIFVQTKYNN